MKPILILLPILACLLCTQNVHAQTSSSVTTQVRTNIEHSNNIDQKVYFQSKMSEFDAYTARNTKNLAESAYNDLKQMMEDYMKDSELKIANTTGADKPALEEKLRKQQSAFATITGLESNLIANKEAIKQQLQEFLQTLY